MLGKSVSCTILVTGSVVDLIIVVCQQLQPVHLSSVENMRLHEIFKVLVVSEDLDWKFRSFKPVSPILESLYDCKRLIRYSIVMFSWVH